MFTGIVERTGRVVSLSSPLAGVAGDAGLMSGVTQLIVDAGKGFETKLGDSVAVNGCCLTVTSNKLQLLAFDVSGETLSRTSLGALADGFEVNLERAMRLGDRLGGHLVSGHIDGVGVVDRVQKKSDGWDVFVRLPLGLSRYVIHKGSICIDGVSLTVNALQDSASGTQIMLTLIPTTVSLTSLKTLQEGQSVAIEVDQIGKFMERLTQVGSR